jgi:hypothetical protein
VGPIQRSRHTSHKIDTTSKEMKEDVAGNVHRKLYGMSDKINAPENQNREFQEGYRVGASSMAYSAELVLKEEFILRIEVDDDLDKGFDEWQRGFWAARSQSILFVSPRRHRKCDKFFGEASDK